RSRTPRTRTSAPQWTATCAVAAAMRGSRLPCAARRDKPRGEAMRASDLIRRRGGPSHDERTPQGDHAAGLTRRDFVKVLGAGLLIAVSGSASPAQVRGRRGGRGGGFAGSRVSNISARLHIGKDGTITVMTGKVEAGQG